MSAAFSKNELLDLIDAGHTGDLTRYYDRHLRRVCAAIALCSDWDAEALFRDVTDGFTCEKNVWLDPNLVIADRLTATLLNASLSFLGAWRA